MTAVLSVLDAAQATRSSKSRVNRTRWRANGTPSTIIPCSGQRSRRSRAVTVTFHAPMSNDRHDESPGRVSNRERVEYPAVRLRAQQPLAAQSQPDCDRAGVEKERRDVDPGQVRRLFNSVVARTAM